MKKQLISSIASIAIICNSIGFNLVSNTNVYADDIVSEDIIDQVDIFDSESTITPISYRVWDDEKKQIVDVDNPCTDYIVVSDDTTVFLSNKTYVVNSDVKISSRITVYTNVNLILCDGFTLTASKGINLTGSLNIYGQTNDTGKLIATGTDYEAGIGGNNNKAGGTITINGGNIVAKGALYSAGIGGGGGGTGGNVTINGGIIEAIGGSTGAGIGGSHEGRGGSVIINGGIVNATGGGNSSGIGKGLYAQSSEKGILILGNNVKLEISTNCKNWINSDTGETRTTYMRTSTINIEPTNNKTETDINYIERIKELEEKISALESENAALKDEIEQLKSGLITGTFGDIDGNDIIDGRDATILLTYYAKTSTGYTGTLAEFVAASKDAVATSSNDT